MAKKSSGNKILDQLVLVEAELKRIEEIRKKIGSSKVKDKTFLGEKYLSELKIDRKRLGIEGSWIDKLHQGIAGTQITDIDSLYKALQNRRGGLKDALGTRYIAVGERNPILNEFGVRVKGGEQRSLNPLWLQRWDKDESASPTPSTPSKKSVSLKIKTNGNNDTDYTSAAAVQSEMINEKSAVQETAPKEGFRSDVFTLNPDTGKMVGVLTRNQRKAFEKKHAGNLKRSPGLYIQHTQ